MHATVYVRYVHVDNVVVVLYAMPTALSEVCPVTGSSINDISVNGSFHHKVYI